MKNYEFYEQKYLEKNELGLDDFTRQSLVHLRRMDNEKQYRDAVEARLYRLEGWEQQWEKLGLS